MITEDQKNTLYKVKEVLDYHNYSTLMSLAIGEGVYYKNPLPEYNSVIAAIKKLPSKVQSLGRFFALGIPIQKKEMAKYFDGCIIEELKNMDIVNYDDDYIWMNNLILISYYNCYFIVGNVYYYPTCQSKEQVPYVGPDSYWLSRMIVNNVKGKVLDLCSGSGIQAILSARTADRVVAVDIDLQAVKFIEVNACLNGLSSKIVAKHGNLFDVIGEEKFDYIIANPPFIPIPSDINFPLAGDGGVAGDSVIECILESCGHHMHFDSELIMIGQTIGDEKKAFLTDLVKKHFGNGQISLTYHSKTIIEHQAEEVAKLCNILNHTNVDSNIWTNHYKKIGATYFYSFMLKIKKNDNHLLNEEYFDDSWLRSDVPVMEGSWKKAYDCYALVANGKQSIVVDEEVIEFIKRIDGSQSLEQIIGSMPMKYKVRYGENYRVKMLAKYIVLCSYLEHNSIMLKK